MILPKVRDPRFITVRRGGGLRDEDHRLLALWAADCAQHVLHHFEQARPGDDRPRRAIELGRAWARGEVSWWDARAAVAAGGSRDDVPEPRVVGGYPATPGFDERAHLEAAIAHGAPPIPILRRILLGD